MDFKFEPLDVVNAAPFTEEQLAAIEKAYQEAPINAGGSFGPFAWDVDFHIDWADITKSYAYLWVKVLGIKIVDGRLDINNPKFAIDATIAGVGVKVEIGIDFNARRIYCKGYLNFIFYKTHYDFTILSF